MAAQQTHLWTHKGETDWHREEIKAAIRIRGMTMARLSTLHGYQESAVKKALSRPWPAVERIIASYLSISPQEIWPSRYDANGMPRRGPVFRGEKSSRGAVPSLRQKNRAA